MFVIRLQNPNTTKYNMDGINVITMIIIEWVLDKHGLSKQVTFGDFNCTEMWDLLPELCGFFFFQVSRQV